MQILQTLARAELTDGLGFRATGRAKPSSRLPRDATVVAILPTASEATMLALQMLHRRGFAVTAILNFYDDYEFGVAAAMLTASGISVQHLKDEASVADVCRQFALR